MQIAGFLGQTEKAKLYDVGIDREGLVRRPLGTAGARLTVKLRGRVDDRWRQAYRSVQLESTGFFRYRLDLESSAISFTCRQADGAADHVEALDRLSSLVEMTNEMASRSAATGGRHLRRPA